MEQRNIVEEISNKEAYQPTADNTNQNMDQHTLQELHLFL